MKQSKKQTKEEKQIKNPDKISKVLAELFRAGANIKTPK